MHSLNWDDYLDSTGYVSEIEEICKIIEKSKTAANPYLLDIGCATGNYSIAFAKRHYNVAGIDYAKGMIGKAVKKAETLKLSNVSFHLGDFNQGLNFSPSKFDFVLSAHTFQGVKEKDEFIKEISRVLKNEGYLFIVTKKKRFNRNHKKKNKKVLLSLIIDIIKLLIFPGYRKTLFDIDLIKSQVEGQGFIGGYQTETLTNHIILFKKRSEV